MGVELQRKTKHLLLHFSRMSRDTHSICFFFGLFARPGHRRQGELRIGSFSGRPQAPSHLLLRQSRRSYIPYRVGTLRPKLGWDAFSYSANGTSEEGVVVCKTSGCFVQEKRRLNGNSFVWWSCSSGASPFCDTAGATYFERCSSSCFSVGNPMLYRYTVYIYFLHILNYRSTF